MPSFVLEWRDPSGTTRRVALTRPLTIGRAPDNDIVLESAQVSRRHCLISPTATGASVDASMSTNGVVIAGHRVRAGRLAAGGRFAVGASEIRLSTGQGEAVGPPRAGRRAHAWAPFVAGGAGALIVLAAIAVVLVAGRGGGSNGSKNPTGESPWVAPDASGRLDLTNLPAGAFVFHDASGRDYALAPTRPTVPTVAFAPPGAGAKLEVPSGWARTPIPDGNGGVLIAPGQQQRDVGQPGDPTGLAIWTEKDDAPTVSQDPRFPDGEGVATRIGDARIYTSGALGKVVTARIPTGAVVLVIQARLTGVTSVDVPEDRQTLAAFDAALRTLDTAGTR